MPDVRSNKFRVAVHEEGEWAIHEPPHDYILTSGGILRQIQWRGDGEERGHEPWRIMPVRRGTKALRFTGLTDAEGVEVYHHDIVEYKMRAEAGSDPTYEWERGLIIFKEGAFRWKSECGGDYNLSVTTESRVIGNKFEHSHLLENFDEEVN